MIEYNLKQIILKLLDKNSYINFIVGNNGEFDNVVSSIIRGIRREEIKDNFAHILILPYITAAFEKDENKLLQYYDDIEICNESSMGYFKKAYKIRNEKMIERSDLIIVYVCEKTGGAYEAFCYARNEGKEIINIADLIKKDEE